MLSQNRRDSTGRDHVSISRRRPIPPRRRLAKVLTGGGEAAVGPVRFDLKFLSVNRSTGYPLSLVAKRAL